MTQHELEVSAKFDAVVRNAIDMLEMSANQLQAAPKLSVLCFAFALELVLTARLIKEHWSLCLEDPQRVSFQKFKSGDILTVSGKSALERIEKLYESDLRRYKEAFEPVWSLRNRLVHFYDPDFANADISAVEQATLKQLKAWHLLHRLLTDDWRDEFAAYLQTLLVLDRKMKQTRQYLQAKYELERKKLERMANGGWAIECPVCGFVAWMRSCRDVGLVQLSCAVCDHFESLVQYECVDCDEFHLLHRSEQPGDECSLGKSREDLVSLIPFEPVCDDFPVGHCSTCGGGVASVYCVWPHYLCLDCGEYYHEIDVEYCDHCAEPNFGIDLSFSYMTGCLGCDGHRELAGMGRADLSSAQLVSQLNKTELPDPASELPETLQECLEQIRLAERKIKELVDERSSRIQTAGLEGEPETREVIFQQISELYDESIEDWSCFVEALKGKMIEIRGG